MKQLSSKQIISSVLIGFFLLTAVGSDDSGSSNSNSYDYAPESESDYSEEAEDVIETVDAEPDFSMDVTNEAIESIEVEPDFDIDEEEHTTSYDSGSEIDTTFSESAEPDFD